MDQHTRLISVNFGFTTAIMNLINDNEYLVDVYPVFKDSLVKQVLMLHQAQEASQHKDFSELAVEREKNMAVLAAVMLPWLWICTFTPIEIAALEMKLHEAEVEATMSFVDDAHKKQSVAEFVEKHPEQAAVYSEFENGDQT